MKKQLFQILLFSFLVSLSIHLSASDIALERIRAAEASGAVDLDLSNLGLTEIPAQIARLSQLESLDLSGNNIPYIYTELSNLLNLQRLILANNNLTYLGWGIGDLANLTYLDLSNNQLEELPLSLGQLEKLEILLIDNNPLTQMPPEILEQNTSAILSYLQHELWWFEKPWIVSILTVIVINSGFILSIFLARRFSTWLENRGQHNYKERSRMSRTYLEVSRFERIFILIAGQISAFIFAIAGLYDYNVHFPDLSFTQALWRTITVILPSWLPFVILLGFLLITFILAAYRLMDAQDSNNRWISILIIGAFLQVLIIFGLFALWLLIPVFVAALGLRLLMIWRRKATN